MDGWHQLSSAKRRRELERCETSCGRRKINSHTSDIFRCRKPHRITFPPVLLCQPVHRVQFCIQLYSAMEGLCSSRPLNPFAISGQCEFNEAEALGQLGPLRTGWALECFPLFPP